MRRVLAVFAATVVFAALAGMRADAATRPHRQIGHGQIRFQGHGPEWWAREARRAKERNRQLEHRLRQRWRPTVDYAIRLAAAVYHLHPGELRAVAWCESLHLPWAVNPYSGAAGLFQFLPSTWAAQGLPGFSVFDPVANALGAARIVAAQGWAQWECKPKGAG